VVAFLVLATAFISIRRGAPWLPSRKMERDALFKAAGMEDGDEFHDLGSGDGTVLFDAARRFPSSRVVGVEVFIVVYLWSQLRRIFGGKKYRNVRIRYGDFYKHDISTADVVFAFQIPRAYGWMENKFTECKDDCRIVVEAWPFEGLEPLRSVKDGPHLIMYAYEGRQFRKKA
jgi:precorrin-6B methylase 2